MESQRVNGKPVNAPEVGEVVLVVGEEKNRSEWKKGRVVRQVKGKDGVVRGVVLLHKGHTIERPLQLVCPLEIRCSYPEPFLRAFDRARRGALAKSIIG
jgi:hypothetical protein